MAEAVDKVECGSALRLAARIAIFRSFENLFAMRFGLMCVLKRAVPVELSVALGSGGVAVITTTKTTGMGS